MAGVQLDVHACQQVLAQAQWFALQQTWCNLARALVEKQSVMNWGLALLAGCALHSAAQGVAAASACCLQGLYPVRVSAMAAMASHACTRHHGAQLCHEDCTTNRQTWQISSLYTDKQSASLHSGRSETRLLEVACFQKSACHVYMPTGQISENACISVHGASFGSTAAMILRMFAICSVLEDPLVVSQPLQASCNGVTG